MTFITIPYLAAMLTMHHPGITADLDTDHFPYHRNYHPWPIYDSAPSFFDRG